jgi:hypothetical protein
VIAHLASEVVDVAVEKKEKKKVQGQYVPLKKTPYLSFTKNERIDSRHRPPCIASRYESVMQRCQDAATVS